MKLLYPALMILLLSLSANSAASELDLSDSAVIDDMSEMAEHGYLEAQLMLGDWYFNGRQVEKDYATALEYYQLAADQGHKRAQCVLGGMYFLGKGVKKDVVKARYWLGLAADKGMKEAKVLLASLNATHKKTRYVQSAAIKNSKPVISSLNLMAR